MDDESRGFDLGDAIFAGLGNMFDGLEDDDAESSMDDFVKQAEEYQDKQVDAKPDFKSQSLGTLSSEDLESDEELKELFAQTMVKGVSLSSALQSGSIDSVKAQNTDTDVEDEFSEDLDTELGDEDLAEPEDEGLSELVDEDVTEPESDIFDNIDILDSLNHIYDEVKKDTGNFMDALLNAGGTNFGEDEPYTEDTEVDGSGEYSGFSDINELEEPAEFDGFKEPEKTDIFGDYKEPEKTDIFDDSNDLEKTDRFDDSNDLGKTDIFDDSNDLEKTDRFDDSNESEKTDIFGDSNDLGKTDRFDDSKEPEKTDSNVDSNETEHANENKLDNGIEDIEYKNKLIKAILVYSTKANKEVSVSTNDSIESLEKKYRYIKLYYIKQSKQLQEGENKQISGNQQGKPIEKKDTPNCQSTAVSDMTVYNDMSLDKLYSVVRSYLIENGVNTSLVPVDKVVAKFGRENIKRLRDKNYIIVIRNGITLG